MEKNCWKLNASHEKLLTHERPVKFASHWGDDSS